MCAVQRAPAIVVMCLLVVQMGAGHALATEPMAPAGNPDVIVLLDDVNGTFLAGLMFIGVGKADDDEPVPDQGLSAPNLARWVPDAPECHRNLRADLDFTPRNLTQSDDSPVELPYRFLLRVDQNGTGGAREVTQPTTNIFLGTAPTGGAFTFDLEMRIGLDVDWHLTLRASRSLLDPGCQPDPLPNVAIAEVEANPQGQDIGNEWVELWNRGSRALDLSVWNLTTRNGATVTVTIPEDTVIAAGARLVVGHTGQWLDNANESVELRDPAGTLWAETPWHADEANDDRSWQLATDGTWNFAPATPGSPPL